jgi:hypothetical protein
MVNCFGVSSITAWLTQASDRANPDRDKTVSVTDKGSRKLKAKNVKTMNSLVLIF